MSTNAERSRRYRAHKRDDHTLCQPMYCKRAGQDRSATAVTRGETLWRDMSGDTLPPPQRLLLEEACRIADRLDKLDRLLDGDASSWVSIVEDNGDPDRQIVVIDRPLAEARQQAAVLKQLLADLRAAGAGGKPAPKRTGEGVAGVTNIATWAPTRSAKASG